MGQSWEALGFLHACSLLPSAPLSSPEIPLLLFSCDVSNFYFPAGGKMSMRPWDLHVSWVMVVNECWAPLGRECWFGEDNACVKCLTVSLTLWCCFALGKCPVWIGLLNYLHFISRVAAANLGKSISLHTTLLHFPRGKKGSQVMGWQQIRLLGWKVHVNM